MTIHIEANKDEIAKSVIMPGDPLRAKYIAENFLQDSKLVSSIRNILAYTGNYNGKEVTVMASGMGNASMGIYSYELYKFYDVENIIRIGTCGAFNQSLNLLDVLLVEKSYSKSTYAKCQNGYDGEILNSNNKLNNKIEIAASKENILLKKGTVLSSDVFYYDIKDTYEDIEKYNCLAVEMETYALFSNAKVLNKNASCILTITDILNPVDNNQKIRLTSEERQISLNKMIKLALETYLN